MPAAMRPATMPVEALKELMVSPVPGIQPGYFIARTALAHIGVAPEMYRGEIEVRDGRPLRGQDHRFTTAYAAHSRRCTGPLLPEHAFAAARPSGRTADSI